MFILKLLIEFDPELQSALIDILKKVNRFLSDAIPRPAPKFLVSVKRGVDMAFNNTVTIKEGTKYVKNRRASVSVDGVLVPGSETTSTGKAAYQLPTFRMEAGQSCVITGVDTDDDGEESEIGELSFPAGKFSPPDAPTFDVAVQEVE